jgi:hypothetical protein
MENLLSIIFMHLKEYGKVETYNYYGEFAEKHFN